MIIFLYGQDTYRSRQKLNEIIEHYKKVHKSGLNLKCLNLKEKNFQDFQDEIQQTSVFNEKKLAILTNVFLNPKFKENFLNQGNNFRKSKDIILFYEEKEIPQNDALFQFFKKHAQSQEFKLLGGQKLRDWAKKEFESRRVKIRPGAVEKLIDCIGNDLWRFSNEIKKLVSYKKDKTQSRGRMWWGEIDTKDVELLVRPKVEADIFKTIDAIASGHKKRALGLLYQHLEKGDSPAYLLSMINFQFRNLLTVKSCEFSHPPYGARTSILTKKLGMHPYVIKKTMEQTRKFTLEELKKIYQKIFRADLGIKTGRLDPRAALDLLIAEM